MIVAARRKRKFLSRLDNIGHGESKQDEGEDRNDHLAHLGVVGRRPGTRQPIT
jgi:hypothetical protein